MKIHPKSERTEPDTLRSKYDGGDSGENGPPPSVLQHSTHAIAGSIGTLGAAGSGRAVGKRAVDQQSRRAVDIGNVDHRLVERSIAAVTDQIVQILRVAVLVAAAHVVRVAGALHRLGLILLGGLVVIGVWVGVGIQVGAVQPHTGPEGEEACRKEDGHDTRRGAATGLVRYCRAAAVVSPTAVWVGWAAARCGPPTSA